MQQTQQNQTKRRYNYKNRFSAAQKQKCYRYSTCLPIPTMVSFTKNKLTRHINYLPPLHIMLPKFTFTNFICSIVLYLKICTLMGTWV
ncbi:hypothetical protein Hanom_Chr11g01049431 [Helianthus anomalus]